jgi:hypothetical protein
LKVSGRTGRPALQRKALAQACRVAVESGDSTRLQAHLEDWAGLPEATFEDQQDLRLAVGTVSAQMMNVLPEKLRHLIM